MLPPYAILHRRFSAAKLLLLRDLKARIFQTRDRQTPLCRLV